MSAAFIVVVLGFSFGWIARELWTVKEEQRAIAKALFARIPMREPSEAEIVREAKGDIAWVSPLRGRDLELDELSQSEINEVVKQRARDSLLDAQRAPKFS